LDLNHIWIGFLNIIFVLDLKHINPFISRKDKNKSMRPTATITMCKNSTLDHDNLFNGLCVDGPSLKSKASALPPF